MKKINAGYESYGNRWGNKIWLVRDMDRKRSGKKDYYCVLGLSKSGWWHLCYGTLKVARAYIRYEEGEITYAQFDKLYEEMKKEA